MVGGAATVRALAILDGAARALAARPLLLGAFAIAAIVPLRMSGPAGPGAAALLVALAATGGLIAAGNRLHEGTEGTWVRRALVAGLLLRLGAAAVLTGMGGFPDEHGYYDALARSAARDWAAGGDSILPDHLITAGRWVYFYLLSAAYYVLGDGMAVGRMLGAALGLGAALLCGELARGFGGRRAAALGVVVLALHPEHAFWSATVARDTLSTVLVLAALVVAVRRDGALLRGGILATVPFLALLAGNAMLPAAALAAGLGAALLVEGARGPVRAAVAAAVAGIVPAALLHRWGPFLTPAHLSRVRAGTFTIEGPATADFLPSMRWESAAGLLAFLPLGAVFVLVAPWPWDATHAHRAAYAPLAAAGAMVALAGIAGLWRAVRLGSPGAVAAAAFAAALLVELALLQGQSGILVRHRLPLTAVLAAAVPLLCSVRDPLPPPPPPDR